MKCLLVVASYHRNAEKIAKTLAETFNAFIIAPQLVRIDELQEYNVFGFASKICHEKSHRSLLDLVDSLLPTSDKKASFFY